MEKTPFSDRDKITPRSLGRERRAVRRGFFLFWVFVIAGSALAIWIATGFPGVHR